MLSSGNGRHRRPKPTPAAVVTVATAAAAGAGIALPLLGATAAQAADNGTWDKVAICETGGLWSANTDNGFYGGLAITQTTWDEYGGDQYAPRPDLASRAQQITVAERILADLGPDAWPGCEDGAGLLKDTAPPDVDPGTSSGGLLGLTPPSRTATASPTAPGDDDDRGTPPASSTPSMPGSGVPTTGAPSTAPPAPGATAPGLPGSTDDAPPGQADGTPPPAPGAPSTPHAGRHGKPYSPTDEQLAAADRASRTEILSTTDSGDAKGAPGVKDKNNNSGDSVTSGAKLHADTYRVGSGDSLEGIASAHHVDGGWHALYDANHQRIGDDPNLIKPGQILNLG
jgi:LysM repeat protein